MDWNCSVSGLILKSLETLLDYHHGVNNNFATSLLRPMCAKVQLPIAHSFLHSIECLMICDIWLNANDAHNIYIMDTLTHIQHNAV